MGKKPEKFGDDVRLQVTGDDTSVAWAEKTLRALSGCEDPYGFVAAIKHVLSLAEKGQINTAGTVLRRYVAFGWLRLLIEQEKKPNG